jgi:hypothetical protein
MREDIATSIIRLDHAGEIPHAPSGELREPQAIEAIKVRPGQGRSVTRERRRRC